MYSHAESVTDWGQALDVKKMQTAADLLCGTHDYKSFCGNKKMKNPRCGLFSVSPWNRIRAADW